MLLQITSHFCTSERLFVGSNKFIDLLSIFWNFQYTSIKFLKFSVVFVYDQIPFYVYSITNRNVTNMSAKLFQKSRPKLQR